MTANWLHGLTNRIAAAAGQDPETLRLTRGEAAAILDVARIAAHTSGERTNAPLLCYLLGLTVARGASLGSLTEVIRAAEGADPGSPVAGRSGSGEGGR